MVAVGHDTPLTVTVCAAAGGERVEMNPARITSAADKVERNKLTFKIRLYINWIAT